MIGSEASRGPMARMDELRSRLRLAYVDGAEDWTTANLGRGLTTDELGRVIGRYTEL